MKLRQPVSGMTHLIGALFSIAGLIWLLVVSIQSRTAWHVASFAVFGASMILLYLASALYHLLPVSERWVARLRRVDHSMIYVFIAGCYTPICLVTLRSGWGWGVFGAIWGVAAVGVVIKWIRAENSRWLTIGPFLIMSWLGILLLPTLWDVLPSGGIFWLAMGGAFYTVGSLIYALKRPDPMPSVFGFHEIWHLFVLGGSACHFLVMTKIV